MHKLIKSHFINNKTFTSEIKLISQNSWEIIKTKLEECSG